jgi:hypothetical protein
MGQALRKSDLDDGCSITAINTIEQPIGQPLSNLEKWLLVADVVELAGVSPQMVKKALSANRWRGADLLVKMVEVGRGGAGGKAPQVHVDSLPADLREAWYLERGIVLHEKPDAETGKMVLVPEQSHQNDARFEADLATARWRQEVIRPAIVLEKGSSARADLIEELAKTPRLFPNGKRKAVTRQTLYNWPESVT